MRKNKVTAILVMIMFALTFIVPGAFASNISDVNGHWGKDSIAIANA
ncbi:MAG TPA: hypothetical protein VFC73_06825 [Syntrophomonadaceae bacterium]|nr:hypothetical protein [Syntrophomonadaceae bacterium]